MLVYRIEHPETGCGPYNSVSIEDMNADDLSFIDRMSDQHSDDYHNHPVMGYDFKTAQLRGDVLCACPSLDSLKKWFNRWMTKLRWVGFKVYEIEVTKCEMSISGKQILIRGEDIISMREIK